nr:hypothetical protein Iba_chr12fCG22470 [Ipomoea batatas]
MLQSSASEPNQEIAARQENAQGPGRAQFVPSNPVGLRGKRRGRVYGDWPVRGVRTTRLIRGRRPRAVLWRLASSFGVQGSRGKNARTLKTREEPQKCMKEENLEQRGGGVPLYIHPAVDEGGGGGGPDKFGGKAVRFCRVYKERDDGNRRRKEDEGIPARSVCRVSMVPKKGGFHGWRFPQTSTGQDQKLFA